MENRTRETNTDLSVARIISCYQVVALATAHIKVMWAWIRLSDSWYDRLDPVCPAAYL